MARKSLIKIGAINISNHHESEKVYADALHLLYESKYIFQANSNTAFMLTTLDSREFSKDKFDIYGVMTRFTVIDKNAPWLNVDNLKFATDKDKANIRIPDNLKPNATGFYFCFNLKKHHLYFENYHKSKVLAPTRVSDFFANGLSLAKIREKHGAFNINIIQERKAVDHLVGIHRIRKLIVKIERPNGDDSNDIFEQAQKNKRDEMEARNLKSEKTEYAALPSLGIDVDEDLRTEMLISTVNGFSKAEGVNEIGEPDNRSTTDMPKIVPTKYNITLSDQQAFDQAVEKYKSIDKPKVDEN